MRQLRLTPLLALVPLGLGLVHATSFTGTGRAASGGYHHRPPQRLLTLRLHGSSPTLSWSPDSRRLVTSADFPYRHLSQPTVTAPRLGLYVVDARTRQHRYLARGSAQHPLWLSNHDIAWGNSIYGGVGASGIFAANTRTWKVRRIWKAGAMMTHAAAGGGLLFFSWQNRTSGWAVLNPATSTTRPTALPATHRFKNWQLPPGAGGSQCRQQVGTTAVRVTTFGVVLTTAGHQTTLPGRPYHFKLGHDVSCHRGGRATPRCGLVRACLSPDGRQVAWFTEGASHHSYLLNVAQVRSDAVYRSSAPTSGVPLRTSPSMSWVHSPPDTATPLSMAAAPLAR